MKFTKEQKELILEGLEQLLIQFTTKCAGSCKYVGLCDAIYNTYKKSIFLYKNEIGGLLIRYIHTNEILFIKIRKLYYEGYWWEKYNYTPRIKYLRKHINKLKKELSK